MFHNIGTYSFTGNSDVAIFEEQNKILYEQQQNPHSCACRVDLRTEDLIVEDDILCLCDQNFI